MILKSSFISRNFSALFLRSSRCRGLLSSGFVVRIFVLKVFVKLRDIVPHQHPPLLTSRWLSNAAWADRPCSCPRPSLTSSGPREHPGITAMDFGRNDRLVLSWESYPSNVAFVKFKNTYDVRLVINSAACFYKVKNFGPTWFFVYFYYSEIVFV